MMSIYFFTFYLIIRKISIKIIIINNPKINFQKYFFGIKGLIQYYFYNNDMSPYKEFSFKKVLNFLYVQFSQKGKIWSLYIVLI